MRSKLQIALGAATVPASQAPLRGSATRFHSTCRLGASGARRPRPAAWRSGLHGSHYSRRAPRENWPLTQLQPALDSRHVHPHPQCPPPPTAPALHPTPPRRNRSAPAGNPTARRGGSGRPTSVEVVQHLDQATRRSPSVIRRPFGRGAPSSRGAHDDGHERIQAALASVSTARRTAASATTGGSSPAQALDAALSAAALPAATNVVAL